MPKASVIHTSFRSKGKKNREKKELNILTTTIERDKEPTTTTEDQPQNCLAQKTPSKRMQKNQTHEENKFDAQQQQATTAPAVIGLTYIHRDRTELVR